VLATPAHVTTPVTPAKASSRKRVSATRSAAATGWPLAAFVLHSYDWSETSLIVELFTREKGRIVVVARGAKRPTSNFRAVLMPFHPLAVQLSKAPAGDAEVHSLRSIELAGWVGGLPLAGSAAARGLFASFHLNELLMKLLPRQDAHPALFDTYAQALPMLALGDDVQGQVAVRAFEVALLRELGWLPDLHQVSQTQQAVQAGQAYQLHGEMGVVRAGPAGQAGPTEWTARRCCRSRPLWHMAALPRCARP
jgi:DNA repair protein RecO (recombination protein O)